MTRAKVAVYTFTNEGFRGLKDFVENRFTVIGHAPVGDPNRSKDSRGRVVELRSDYNRVAWNDALGIIPNQRNGEQKIKYGQLKDMALALDVPLADLLAAGHATGPALAEETEDEEEAS